MTLNDLARPFAKQHGLDKAKWPEFATTIDKIPLTAIGKVQRGELEEFVQKELEHRRSA